MIAALDLKRFANSWGEALPEEVEFYERPPQWRVSINEAANGRQEPAVTPIHPITYSAYDIHFLAESWGAKPVWLKKAIRKYRIPFVRSRQIDLYGTVFFTWVVDAEAVETLREAWQRQFRVSRMALRGA